MGLLWSGETADEMSFVFVISRFLKITKKINTFQAPWRNHHQQACRIVCEVGKCRSLRLSD